MAVKEHSAQEILLEQLAQRVAALAAEQKAKEMAIKGLNDEIKLATAATEKKLRELEVRYENRRMELDAAIQPLEGLKHEVPRLRAEIEQLKREKADAVGAIRVAKGGAIKEADEHVARAQQKLNKIETLIQTCKEKVAAL